jgi:hypothetical protein
MLTFSMMKMENVSGDFRAVASGNRHCEAPPASVQAVWGSPVFFPKGENSGMAACPEN